HIYVILFNKKPIGLTSPTTLVCTAADCYGRISSSVTWCGTRFLEDPIDELNQMEKEAMAGWLEKARRDLQTDNDVLHSSPLWNALSKLIATFVQDLAVAASRDTQFSETGARMNGVFAHIDFFVATPLGDPEDSPVRLVPSDGKKPPVSLLLVDEAVAEQWQMTAQDVAVLGAKTLASIPFGGLSGERDALLGRPLRSERWKCPAEWRTGDDFFTEKLFVLDQPSALLSTLGVSGGDTVSLQGRFLTPILPLKEEILLYLGPEDIARRMSFEQSAEGVTVRLKLPLRGYDRGEGSRDFEIVRKYEQRENEIAWLRNVPLLEVWPHFTTTTWRAYYVYYSSQDVS
ncbi:MAG: hypothetical protein ACRD2L_00700, partial [Terriglobia bacterium]